MLSIDPAAQTATLQPGIVWENADRELKKRGVTLRTYPSSYPSATAGGWLAQGGAGFGAYESGWFRDTVTSARVVRGDGTVAEVTGDALDLVYEAEGITGLISSLTLKVQPDEPMEVIALGCPEAHSLQHMLEGFMAADLPIWSMHFINPKMAQMKNLSPLLEHQGHPVEKRVLLPETTSEHRLRKKDAEFVRESIAARMSSAQCKAELLSEEIAEHEWKQRFRIMTVKRWGRAWCPPRSWCHSPGWARCSPRSSRKSIKPVVKEGMLVARDAMPKVSPKSSSWASSPPTNANSPTTSSSRSH